MRRFIILLSFYTTVVKGGDSNNNIIEYLDTLKFELGLSVNEEETSKSCWLNPGLLNSCTDTDMNQRQRMAIKLSNCHMSEAGLETFECHPDTDLSVCKLHLSKSQVGFNVYTSIFFHLDNLCFYLKSEAAENSLLRHVKTLQQSSDNTLASINQLETQTEEMFQQSTEAFQIFEKSSLKALANQESLLSGQTEVLSSQAELGGWFNKLSVDMETMAVKQQQASEQVEKSMTNLHSQQTSSLSLQNQLSKRIIQANEGVEQLQAAQQQGFQEAVHRQSQVTDLLHTSHKALHHQSQAQVEAARNTRQLLEGLQADTAAAHQHVSSLLNGLQSTVATLLRLDHSILAEVLHLSALGFYLPLFGLILVMTSSISTGAARVPGLLVALASLFTERLWLCPLLLHWALEAHVRQQVLEIFRYGMAGLLLAGWTRVWRSYQDKQELSLNLLKNNRNLLLNLEERVQNLGLLDFFKNQSEPEPFETDEIDEQSQNEITCHSSGHSMKDTCASVLIDHDEPKKLHTGPEFKVSQRVITHYFKKSSY